MAISERTILERIAGEAGSCDCDDHAVRFSREEVEYAKARVETRAPFNIPCLACGQNLNQVPTQGNQPLGGLEFTTPGHYGSAVFDPMDGTRIAINICDGCLDAARIRGNVLHINSHRYSPWK